MNTRKQTPKKILRFYIRQPEFLLKKAIPATLCQVNTHFKTKIRSDRPPVSYLQNLKLFLPASKKHTQKNFLRSFATELEVLVPVSRHVLKISVQNFAQLYVITENIDTKKHSLDFKIQMWKINSKFNRCKY